jgi:hypothetical protein
MTTSHWAQRSQHWNRSQPPLRPDPAAVQLIQDLIGNTTSDILLLGVTRELTQAFENVVAVEREPGMISNVWLGDTDSKRVIHNDWLKVQFPHERFGGAVGDGSINQVAFPHDQLELLDRILDWLEPGGVFACRMYTRPDTPITLDDLRREGLTPTINWSAYRRMLSMYLAEIEGQTIHTRNITAVFDELFPDRSILPWTQQELEMIDTYATSKLQSCLPTRKELEQIIPSRARDVQFIDVGNYDLAHCCPVLTFKK